MTRQGGLAERGNRRATSRRAHSADRFAEAVVTIGGMAVLAAVLGICVYLVYEVAPLFGGGSASPDGRTGWPVASAPVVTIDETGRAALSIDKNGVASVWLLDSGERLSSRSVVPEGVTVTATSSAPGGRRVALGLSDGSVVFGEIGFETTLLGEDTLPDAARAMPVGTLAPAGGFGLGAADGSVLDHPVEGRFRLTSPVFDLSEPTPLASVSPVTRIDHQQSPAGQLFLAARHADGTSEFRRIRLIKPLDGGAARVRASGFALDSGAGEPGWLFVSGTGQMAIELGRDGAARWYATDQRKPDEPVAPAGTVRLTPEGVGVTTASWLLGSQSLLVAGDDGVVRCWFLAADPGGNEPVLKMSHRVEVGAQGGGVRDVASSGRDRVAAFLTGDSRVELRHLTSEKTIADLETGAGDARRVLFSPDGGKLLVVDAGGSSRRWSVEAGHAEAGFKTLFGKVLYEGASEPAFVYQSSSGDDAAEVKLSLTPLIFGTLKATIFAMLFAAPIAVLAAVYSSEFLSPNAHRVVKPTLELMASLPSVVLGFIAAFVAAPFVRDWLGEVLLAFVVTPVFAVFCAHLWTALPRRWTERVGPTRKLGLIALALAGGVALSVPLGGVVEAALFTAPDGEASLRRWLDGSFGGAAEGWFVALLAPALIVVCLLRARLLGRRIAEAADGLGTAGGSVLGAALLLGELVVAGALAAGLGWLLGSLGFDPRESVFGPFSQRNTLVVGLIMGFAVIPIIYTISDDAMRSVPAGLRSASLGAGATPWQTAIRVVLPVAASGIFSAVMIGLGRAVGETMIVLMATGNTPVMEWNIFGGFRTLAANIAVELPEAPKDSTHYRVLFLCGLVLFAMTFVINTTAELVRQHFRRRNASL